MFLHSSTMKAALKRAFKENKKHNVNLKKVKEHAAYTKATYGEKCKSIK